MYKIAWGRHETYPANNIDLVSIAFYRSKNLIGAENSKNNEVPVNCKNHPEVSAVDRCVACAESFCPDCLVEIHGQKYCGSCKVMAVKGQPVFEADPSIPCPEANEALRLAILSIFCFGIFLAPLALSKASKAKKIIAANPRLLGSGKATAATVIGWCVLGMWIFGAIVKITETSK